MFKSIRGFICIASVCTCFALSTFGESHAALISVNLAGAGAGTVDVVGDTGVVNAGNWNNFDNSGFSTTGAAGQNITIVDSDAANTSVEVSSNSTSTVSIGATYNNGDVDFSNLFAGRTDSIVGDLTITATNIPYASYDVYVYAGVTPTTSHDFDLSVNGGTSIRINHPTAGSAAFSGFVQSTGANEGNYALFTGQSSSTLTILADNGQSNLKWLTGFQIVDTTVVAAVPEPSSYLVAGLGLVGFGLIRRRRRRS